MWRTTISTAKSKQALLTLVAFNVVTSILHYVDNVIYFKHYPEPTWLNPHLVDAAWFVMTPFGILGGMLFLRGRYSLAFTCLYTYSMMGLLVLGHYLIAPPWEVSFRINLFIVLEAVSAILLGLFTAWLQYFRSPTSLPPSPNEA